MKTESMPSFKAGGFYRLTSTTQDVTLINRGLIDIGGCAIPQAIMSNNKEEARERLRLSGLYFVMSMVTPFIMLPILNKTFLKSNGIIKNLKNNEKRIIEVSKEYLTKDSKYLVEGIKETGKKLKCEADFDNILTRFKGKEDVLLKKLANAHKNIWKTDFLTTAWMWVAAPWITTEITERKTHKKGFSAAFDMVGDTNIHLDEKKYKANKRKKMLASFLIGTIPPFIVPPLVMKAMTSKSKNLIKTFAHNFDYSAKGISMSKTIFALMWAMCDYPSAIVSARDKYERKDRAIRIGALFVTFFGGDFVINNIFGRIIDKAAGTTIMNTDTLSKGAGFFEKFKMLPRRVSEIDFLKNVSSDVIKKTKRYSAGLYWFSLLANMGLIGFALPAILNATLRKDLAKDFKGKNNMPPAFLKSMEMPESKVFEQFIKTLNSK